jgi:hypothetical protein
MRINTSGKKEWHTDLYERTRALDENTKTGAIDAACIHANQDIEGKQQAIEFLAGRLSPAELEQVAEILSTDQIEVSVTVETSVSADWATPARGGDPRAHGRYV